MESMNKCEKNAAPEYICAINPDTDSQVIWGDIMDSASNVDNHIPLDFSDEMYVLSD